MPNTYGFIAYRGEGFDTCRGQLMSQSCSSFGYASEEDVNRVGDELAKFLIEDETFREEREYQHFEFHYFVNGVETKYDKWLYEHDPETKETWDLFKPVFDRANQIASIAMQEARDKKAREKAHRAWEQQQRDEKEEKELYKRLQQKYESSNNGSA